ncbi:MAG: hypothetical protein AAFO58_11960, partial [Pseudomonadota bacterium]
MKQHLISLAVGVTALALMTLPATSQTRNCADRDTVLAKLSGEFGETRQSVGVAANNSIVETFANADSGSWTITVTLPNGTMCLVASGQSFEALAAVASWPMATG